MIIHIKMSEVQVEVRNAAGDLIGSFSDAAGFRKWRAQMQKERGEKKIAAGIADPNHNRYAFADVPPPSWELRSCAAEVCAHNYNLKQEGSPWAAIFGRQREELCALCTNLFSF